MLKDDKGENIHFNYFIDLYVEETKCLCLLLSQHKVPTSMNLIGKNRNVTMKSFMNELHSVLIGVRANPRKGMICNIKKACENP